MNLALALSKVPRVIEVTGGYSTDARKNEYSPELRREIVCVVILCRVITTHPVEWQAIMAWLIRERDIAPKSKRLCSIFSEWVKRGLVFGEVRPRYVYVENSPALTSRGLGAVLGDLAAMGYDTKWMCLSAAECGALHRRDRLWIVADSNGTQRYRERVPGGIHTSNDRARVNSAPERLVADSASFGQSRQGESVLAVHRKTEAEGQANHVESVGLYGKWPAEPDVGRVVDGMAARVDRLTAIGNGQVPRVAATAWELLNIGKAAGRTLPGVPRTDEAVAADSSREEIGSGDQLTMLGQWG